MPAGTQPCDTFGVYPKLTEVQSLYAGGELAFVANIGALVEPLTKDEYNSGAKEVPPSLFAHNIIQRSAQNVHAQQADAKGVLGRMADVLSEDGCQLCCSCFALGLNVCSIHRYTRLA